MEAIVMKKMVQIFVSGLLVLLPIIFTAYITIWLISSFESIFKKTIVFLFPEHYVQQFYFPGMGIIGGVILIFIVGFLMQNWGLNKLYAYGESLVEKSPIVGSIYSALKSLIQYFTSADKDSSEQVVALEYQGIKMLGIVTKENFENAPIGIAGKNMVAVFLPMSYQLGGYTVYMDKKFLTPVNMSKKEALQWILTAGIG